MPTAAPPTPDPRLPALGTQVEEILDERGGTYGVTLEFVPTHQRTSHAGDQVFESASVYKIGVAYAVLHEVDQGHLSLSDQLMILDDDAVEPEPRGGLGVNDQVSIWEALQAMMGVSSNSAAHLLMRQVGHPELNLALDALGLHATRVPLEADDAGDTDAAAVTTSSDMAHLLELLADDRILSPESRANLRTLLGMRKYLDPLVAYVPDGTEVLSKNGNQERASNVAGLVATPEGPLIISIFDEDVDPGDARATIAAITQAAWDAYSE